MLGPKPLALSRNFQNGMEAVANISLGNLITLVKATALASIAPAVKKLEPDSISPIVCMHWQMPLLDSGKQARVMIMFMKTPIINTIPQVKIHIKPQVHTL